MLGLKELQPWGVVYGFGLWAAKGVQLPASLRNALPAASNRPSDAGIGNARRADL